MSESKIFLNGTPVYISSTAKSASGKLTGTYYIWGSAVINGRYRVTNSEQNIGKTGQVTGWVSASDIDLPKTETKPSGSGDSDKKIAELNDRIGVLSGALNAIKNIVTQL